MAIGYGNKSSKRQSGPREWYMNWGGWFAEPNVDPDVFHRLPVVRQKEIVANRKLFDDNPGLRAIACVNLATCLPYPGQKIAKDFAIVVKVKRVIHLPMSRVFNAPKNVPVSFLRRKCKEPRKELPTESAAHLVAFLEQELTLERLKSECTLNGEGRELRDSRPASSLFCYLWRVARFKAGIDPTLPTTLLYELEDGLEVITKQRIRVTPSFYKQLDPFVNRLLQSTGIETVYQY